MAAAVVAGVVKQPTTNCSRILISVSAQKNFDLQPKSSAFKMSTKNHFGYDRYDLETN